MQPLRLSVVVAFEVLWRFHQDGHTCKCSAWKIIYFLDYLLYVTSKPDNNKLDCLIVSWISDFDKMHAYTDISLAVFFKECIQDFTTSNLFFFSFIFLLQVDNPWSGQFQQWLHRHGTVQLRDNTAVTLNSLEKPTIKLKDTSRLISTRSIRAPDQEM